MIDAYGFAALSDGAGPIGLKFRWVIISFAWLLLIPVAAMAQAQDMSQPQQFETPILQATFGIATCPVPHQAKPTPEEVRAQAHYRAERGNSCYQSGRCRLPNSYMYDPEIVPRVKKAILADGRFGDTSIWVEGQRRWVWLKGCVRDRLQAQSVEQLVRSIDDVEAVINELSLPDR
jgi:hypothetical protein